MSTVQPHKEYLEKMRMVPQLDKILEKAVYIKSVPNRGEDFNILKFHYFGFQIGREQSYIVVKELRNCRECGVFGNG